MGPGQRVAGYLAYIDRELGFFFQATEIATVEIAIDASGAKITGSGRLNGRAGYRFVLSVEDGGPHGQGDRLRMQLVGRRGYRYDSFEVDDSNGRIHPGDVRIQPLRVVLTPAAAEAARKEYFARLAENDLPLPPSVPSARKLRARW